jgi:dihydrofolate synthase/folylpolyglutamate synthase
MTPDRWLESYYDGEYFTGRFDHLKEVVEKLNLNKNKFKIVTIAGTNGKGETTRSIADLLTLYDYKVGVWTSPHLFKVNERFEFSNSFVCDEELIRVFNQLKTESFKNKFKLSYFEFLFISFLMLAKNKDLDFLLLEVGLGGRLDAVNVLDADVCVLTSISRDHQEILGKRYDEILLEKLGITRNKSILYSTLELQYLRKKVSLTLKGKISKWRDLFADGTLQRSDNFSRRNKFLSAEVVSELIGRRVKLEEIQKSYACRYKFECYGAKFELFPSHNVDGLRKLVQFLGEAKYNKYNCVLVGFSERSMEDLRVMVNILKAHFIETEIIIYRFEHFKALNEKFIKQIMEEFGLEVTDDKKLYQIFNSQKKSQVLVTGSNYFIGEFVNCHEGQSLK